MNEKEQNQELEELEKVDEIFEAKEIQEETEQVLEEVEECVEDVNTEEDTTSGRYEYYESNYVRTKPLGRLVLLVAFTAIMLITSTYAWFSTQRNVTLTGLKGEVNVAEGLQISLDAERWFNTINFDDFNQPANGGAWTMKAGASAQYIASGKTFQNPADGVINTTPSEYLPVSSTGSTIAAGKTDGIGATAMKFYKGNVENFDHLEDITDAVEATDGYFAFDLFVMNTSSEDIKFDNILLDPVSDVLGVVETTGVQNTARVAFALYENANDSASHIEWNETGYTAGGSMTIDSGNQLTPAQIVAGTSTSKNIKDIAIWEPNANDHVTSIVNQFKGQMTWPATWTTGKGSLPTGDFVDGDYLPTYALTIDSKTATYQGRQLTGANTPGDTSDDTYATETGIKDIFDWSATGIGQSKLKLQYTTQTAADEGRTSINLNSLYEYENPTGKENDGTTTNDGSFDIPANQYSKIRVYVWMEGQDPDCINYASLGAGLTLNLGFSKDDSEDNAGAEEGWVSPSSIYDEDWSDDTKLHIGDFVNYDAGTWTASEIADIKTGLATSPVAANNSISLPDTSFQFGGFSSGSSRNGNATPFSNWGNYTYVSDGDEDGKIGTGWRVFDINGNNVTLISAGNPEDYYHEWNEYDAYISEYILTGNVNGYWSGANTSLYVKRDWSDYVNTAQKATSATVLTKSGLDAWYSKYTTAGTGANTSDEDTFQLIYGTDKKIQTVVDNYSFYWLSDATGPNRVYYVDPNGRRVHYEGSLAFGVRVLVSLSSDILFSEERADTTTLSGGRLGEETQDFNVWNIK